MTRTISTRVAAVIAATLVVALAVSAGLAAAPSEPGRAAAHPAVARAAVGPVATALATVRTAQARYQRAGAKARRAKVTLRRAKARLRQVRRAHPPRPQARTRAARKVRTARVALRRTTRARTTARSRLATANTRLRTARGQGRPNVVVFLLDDMRADELVHLPKTRRLLAGSGLQLTDAVSAHPLCCPARAQLFTGQYAQNNGVRHNSGPRGGYAAFDPSATVATALRGAGYRTALHGKYLNGYGPYAAGREPGWDTWDALVAGAYDYHRFRFANGDLFGRDYVTDRLTERSLRTIGQEADRDSPFFLTVSHPAPHYAWGSSSWGGGGAANHNPPPGKAAYLRAYAGTRAPYLADPAFGEQDLSDKPAAYLRVEGHTDADYVQRQYVGRAAALRSVDDGIAATVERLRSLGELRNTYLVVTSDNGYALGEHQTMGKNTFYDQSLAIPMLVSGPGVRSGDSDLPVHLADLSATILDLTGARAALTLDGVSFAPALSGDRAALAAGWRDSTLLLAGEPERVVADQWGFRGVRTERYTYGVSWHDPDVAVLFDRDADPHELTSVHDDPRYAAVRAELDHRAVTLSACAGATCHTRFGPLPEVLPAG